MNPGSFAGIARRTTIDGQRRATYVLAASNASFPIPSWAQGGKGIVYVTGCGGGASGGISTTSGRRGTGGGAGAIATRHLLLIPSGVTTLNCQIGAAGAGITAGFGANGNNGGNTSVSAGSQSLVLEGGVRGTALTDVLRGGTPLPNGQSLAGIGAGSMLSRGPLFGVIGNNNVYGGLSGAVSTLAQGAQGGGDHLFEGFGGGAVSPWGAGGAPIDAGPTVNTNGGNATGYGAGGAGALWVSGASVTSGAGTPGFLFLEIEECL